MPDDTYQVGEHVQVYLDSQFWKSEGWYGGTVIRIDPYSSHRSFIWVELDTSVMDVHGGSSSVLSVLNPKNIKSMNDRHEANRKYWDAAAQGWQRLRDDDQLWRKCPQQPELAFAGDALNMIRQFAAELAEKQVLVIGSGDNYAAFALAGMGALVTSTDISEEQLKVAEKRSKILGLDIRFARCDAAGLCPLPDASFDLVCSTNGFFIWIADPGSVFAAVARVLKPGGYYIFYDIHPFMRPWKDQVTLEMEKPYVSTAIEDGEPAQTAYEFHWTLGDLINPLLSSGLRLCKLAETPAKDSRFWQDYSYQPGSNNTLMDWRQNPRPDFPSG